jgi:hypothetical protein
MQSVELLKGLIRLEIFARRLDRKPLGHRFVFRILCNTSPCSHSVSTRLSTVQDSGLRLLQVLRLAPAFKLNFTYSSYQA